MDEAEFRRRGPELALALAAPHVHDVFEVRLCTYDRSHNVLQAELPSAPAKPGSLYRSVTGPHDPKSAVSAVHCKLNHRYLILMKQLFCSRTQCACYPAYLVCLLLNILLSSCL